MSIEAAAPKTMHSTRHDYDDDEMANDGSGGCRRLRARGPHVDARVSERWPNAGGGGRGLEEDDFPAKLEWFCFPGGWPVFRTARFSYAEGDEKDEGKQKQEQSRSRSRAG